MLTAPMRSAADAASALDRSIDELDAEICSLASDLNVRTYRMLMLVREFDDRMGWAKWGLRSCAEWLAWRCGLSVSAAREKVRTAQALRALPAISLAFSDGTLSYSKVRALTRVAHLDDEDSLLDYALRVTAPQVEERCRQIRNATSESSPGAWRAWERRSLTLIRDDARGVIRISVELPTEQGEVIAKALQRAAETGDAAVGIEFTGLPANGVRDSASPASAANGWSAHQADALVTMAKDYLSGGPHGEKSSSAGDRYQLVVHTDSSALHGGSGRCDLPLETVKRLACDGSLITVVEDKEGTPLDVGRKTRTITAALRRALLARDRHCAFPGCQNRCYVDGHHIEHWADGGETKLDNLVLLCTHHHTLVHEGGFQVRRDEAGAIYFRRPDGRGIPRFGYRLDDLRDDDSGEEHPSMEVREPAWFYQVPGCASRASSRCGSTGLVR